MGADEVIKISAQASWNMTLVEVFPPRF
jgi:hypothetical protein